jgi:hypothetical protein
MDMRFQHAEITARQTAAPVMPNFLIIGAMKAGTTSLYHYLRAHPEVFMPSVKELDFFVGRVNWERGIGWYGKHFEGAAGARAIGEASTAYTKYPVVEGVPQRIAAHLPDVRLIYVVRDPIDRMRSHYQHRVALGAEREPLRQAVLQNRIYLNCSRYALQLEQYLEHFPRDQVLVVTSEGLRHNRRAVLRRVYAFLGVDSSYVPDVIEREFYRTEERATYSPAAWGIRRTLKRLFPATKRAKELVDTIIPRSMTRVLRRRRDTERTRPDSGLNERLRSELVDLLREDVRRLRSYMPETFDCWGIT